MKGKLEKTSAFYNICSGKKNKFNVKHKTFVHPIMLIQWDIYSNNQSINQSMFVQCQFTPKVHTEATTGGGREHRDSRDSIFMFL